MGKNFYLFYLNCSHALNQQERVLFRLDSLLENCLKTQIVGFWWADFVCLFVFCLFVCLFVSRVRIWTCALRRTLPLPDDRDCICRDPRGLLEHVKSLDQYKIMWVRKTETDARPLGSRPWSGPRTPHMSLMSRCIKASVHFSKWIKSSFEW